MHVVYVRTYVRMILGFAFYCLWLLLMVPTVHCMRGFVLVFIDDAMGGRIEANYNTYIVSYSSILFIHYKYCSQQPYSATRSWGFLTDGMMIQ
jgi:hypothetical protein